jgi:hypothetical protein
MQYILRIYVIIIAVNTEAVYVSMMAAAVGFQFRKHRWGLHCVCLFHFGSLSFLS